MDPLIPPLDEQTRVTVAELAQWRGVTEAEFAAEAIRRVAAHDVSYRAFVQEGIDAADRGDLISQEEMERWFESRAGEHRRG